MKTAIRMFLDPGRRSALPLTRSLCSRPLPAKGAGLSGERLRIGEPQLIGREPGLWLARIDWWRPVDFCDRTSHEQALAYQFGEAEIQHFQGVQTPRDAQEQIGNHRGE